MKFPYFSLIFLGILILLSACGGASEETNDNETETSEATDKDDENTETEEEDSSEPEKMCFAAEDDLTKGYFNFIFEGDKFTGTASFVTPKAGMTLYTNYNIEGTKSGDELSVSLSLADTHDGQGIGTVSKETWYLEEDRLVLDKSGEGLLTDAPKVECSPDTQFELEVKEMVIEQNTYDYEGTIDGNLKIVARFNTKTDPDDKQTRIITGYYYYVKSGANNKIQLEGSQSDMGMLPAMIYEMKDGKQFGKFVFEQGNVFGEELDGLWISTDGSKELAAVLFPK